LPHAKRDIAIEGYCTSGEKKGDALSPTQESRRSNHKKIPPLMQPRRNTRFGIEPTTYRVYFKPHGKLSQGGWETGSRILSRFHITILYPIL